MKFCLIVGLLSCVFAYSAAAQQLQLELLQVLFTHGDRTPSESEIYKNDPYKSVYEQIGYGKLTETGTQQAYKLGEALRQRYNDFLGVDLRNEDVHARSTDVEYTKKSLELALTGLTDAAIPAAHHDVEESDFLYSHMLCPRYREMIRQRVNERVGKMNVEDQRFLDHIEESTGIGSADRVHTLYANLRSALSLGLPLPSWCSTGDFAQIEQLAESYYSAITDTLIMMKLNAGETVERLLKNIESHDSGVGAKKVYLYAAHDFSLAGFANVHNYAGVPKIPEHASAVVVEKLRSEDGEAYLRMLLWTGASEQWIALELQACGHECALADYRVLIDWVLPYGQVEEVCG